MRRHLVSEIVNLSRHWPISADLKVEVRVEEIKNSSFKVGDNFVWVMLALGCVLHHLITMLLLLLLLLVGAIVFSTVHTKDRQHYSGLQFYHFNSTTSSHVHTTIRLSHSLAYWIGNAVEKAHHIFCPSAIWGTSAVCYLSHTYWAVSQVKMYTITRP